MNSGAGAHTTPARAGRPDRGYGAAHRSMAAEPSYGRKRPAAQPATSARVPHHEGVVLERAQREILHLRGGMNQLRSLVGALQAKLDASESDLAMARTQLAKAGAQGAA